MGLLDKVESNETKKPKKATAKAAKAAKVAEAVPVAAKAAKPKKEKKPKVKKARPASLSSEYEIAPKLSRVISGGLISSQFLSLIAGLVMSALTGGSSGGLETTILFIVAIVALFFQRTILANLHWT